MIYGISIHERTNGAYTSFHNFHEGEEGHWNCLTVTTYSCGNN